MLKGYNVIPNFECKRFAYCLSVTVSFVLPFFVTVRLSFVKEACPSSVSFTIRGILLNGEPSCSTIIFVFAFAFSSFTASE